MRQRCRTRRYQHHYTSSTIRKIGTMFGYIIMTYIRLHRFLNLCQAQSQESKVTNECTGRTRTLPRQPSEISQRPRWGTLAVFATPFHRSLPQPEDVFFRAPPTLLGYSPVTWTTLKLQLQTTPSERNVKEIGKVFNCINIYIFFNSHSRNLVN